MYTQELALRVAVVVLRSLPIQGCEYCSCEVVFPIASDQETFNARIQGADFTDFLQICRYARPLEDSNATTLITSLMLYNDVSGRKLSRRM